MFWLTRNLDAQEMGHGGSMPSQQVVEPGQVAAEGEVDCHEESQDQKHDRKDESRDVRVRGKSEELRVNVGITVDGVLQAVEVEQRGQAEDAADDVEYEATLDRRVATPHGQSACEACLLEVGFERD